MKDYKIMLKNKNGFTLIEIIAVLVLLGILAAVAVPKYIDLATQGKIKAAQGEVAEVKSTLNMGYYKSFMINSVAPATASSIITSASLVAGANALGTAPDLWNVTLAAGTPIAITVNNRNGDAAYTGTGSWNIPQ
jgi:prepilin-type N-terminal cleavage/methylation domain-containing protein